ncbi:hypothetical protein Pcinc_037115 [Petrolisthes cinctipes]|uniref:Fe2OG dioxygenase domain-containing protein n=1 Tax=Petrolisthes cinctipes TaxID=88211 RepID=A0AAE1ELX2_PETCI|nr:hypothetical protein Pcinc_037115 [Petrolisthes cinctipes]
MSTEVNTIPIVNLGQLGLGVSEEPREEEWLRVAKELKGAFCGVGFVYLDNHGIPSTLVEKVFGSAAKFFSLDKEIKTKYRKKSFGSVEGYVEMDQEQLDDKTDKLFEIRESFYLKYMETGIFPVEEVPELKSHMTALYDACLQLIPRLLTAMSLALDLERDFFTLNHQKLQTMSSCNSSTMRLNYYPPVPPNTPEKSIRCGTHTDYGTITLLFQDSMGGLQVQDVSGSWVEARPIPGTILVNAGDLLQIWTSGKFVATVSTI